jgi:hypothetical protein
MSTPRRIAALALAAAALVAAPVHAQYQRLGFVAAGKGGLRGSDAYDGQFTVAAGFIARFNTPAGVYVAFRTPVVWSRFTAGDGSPAGTGAHATITESGIDLMPGYDTGFLGGYGWYGIHYVAETREEQRFTPGGGAVIEPFRRSDLGPSYGAGLQIHVTPRASVFGEWFRGGGFDAEMLRTEGLRFGVMGAF